MTLAAGTFFASFGYEGLKQWVKPALIMDNVLALTSLALGVLREENGVGNSPAAAFAVGVGLMQGLMTVIMNIALPRLGLFEVLENPQDPPEPQENLPLLQGTLVVLIEQPRLPNPYSVREN